MIRIFTDGACSGNPGPGGWAAILSTGQNVKELGGFDPATTNNRMELKAAIEALKALLRTDIETEIYTDSKYVILGASQWLANWQKNNWQTSTGKDVENRDLWEELAQAKDRLGALLSWHYVPGHAGIPGNERCDAIAVAFSQGQNPALFSGTRVSYGIDLDHIATESPQAKSKAPVYLSYVNGEVYRDLEWSVCRKRIHGVMGAKYKKVRSEAEAQKVLRQWGIDE